jgi:hypothetical protein
MIGSEKKKKKMMIAAGAGEAHTPPCSKCWKKKARFGNPAEMLSSH